MRFRNWIDGGPISTPFDVATYKLYTINPRQSSPSVSLDFVCEM